MIKWKKKCNCIKCKQKIIDKTLPLIHLINECDVSNDSNVSNDSKVSNVSNRKSIILYSPEKSLLKPLQPSEPLYYSNFYNQNDKIQIINPGESIEFPCNGPSNCFIFRLNDSQFNLTLIGTYEIYFHVYIETPGQLVINLNNIDLLYTLSGSSHNNVITAHFLITTQIINSIISINNPNGTQNTDPVIKTFQNNGGVYLTTSHLIIKKIN